MAGESIRNMYLVLEGDVPSQRVEWIVEISKNAFPPHIPVSDPMPESVTHKVAAEGGVL